MKKQKNSNLNIWARYGILIIVTIVIGFLANVFLYIPVPSLANVNAWLGFFGSIIGAGIAGLVTLWGIEYTIKNTLLNVKPVIRPVRTDFFLYDNQGIFVTEKSRSVLVKEFSEKEKVYFSEMDKYDYVIILNDLVEEYQDREWGEVFAQVDADNLFEEIKSICKSRTYGEAFSDILNRLPEKYNDGVGEKLAEKIHENFRRKIVYEAMSEAKRQSFVFFWLYNVGAGNAIDIRIAWDFSKNYHKKLCNELGFSENEYMQMLSNFSLDRLAIAEADIMLNTNTDNKVKAFVPNEVILFIKYLYRKSLENNKEKNTNNNALVSEQEISLLKISYTDIHGQEHTEYYDVIFKMSSTFDDSYDYKEQYFYLKFNKNDRKNIS
ncbi:hypothetical protein [Paenibacillus sp. AN1007]|uniref:Phage abortive infection protein n=1 Tax=Paenibacillus sp. AN1007 TaxID=3151385 RepID=A0AAU8N7Y0_9BACL